MAAFLPLSNGESETVFTTCIYNNIGYEYKIPHDVDCKFLVVCVRFYGEIYTRFYGVIYTKFFG